MPTKGKYLKGQLLLDGGSLRGSFFHRSVVLICAHDSEGAFGLVLNRPTGNTAGEVILSPDLPERLKDKGVFLGGPVQAGALSYLHSDSNLTEGTVLPDIALGHSIDDLASIATNASDLSRVRLFAGYAGWSPGQLEDEMKREAWLTHPATSALVFDSQPELLWKKILSQKGWNYKLLAESPEDPSHN